MKHFINWLLDSHFPWIIVIKKGDWLWLADFNKGLAYDRIYIKGKPTIFCFLV